MILHLLFLMQMKLLDLQRPTKFDEHPMTPDLDTGLGRPCFAAAFQANDDFLVASYHSLPCLHLCITLPWFPGSFV